MDVQNENVVDEDGLRTSGEQEGDEEKSKTDESHDQESEYADELARSVCFIEDRQAHNIDWRNRLRRCLLLAALACILRPTNALIWACIACFTILRTTTQGRMLPLPWEGAQMWVHITTLTLLPATKKERLTLVREVLMCGYEARDLSPPYTTQLTKCKGPSSWSYLYSSIASTTKRGPFHHFDFYTLILLNL